MQVPLLPQLRVLRVTSLWWRLPLCVLSGALEEVAYKRLTSSEYGSYVMTDLQVGFELRLNFQFSNIQTFNYCVITLSCNALCAVRRGLAGHVAGSGSVL
jgi:hypothetical protein